MPNSIKYSASAQTLALKKGNFWIGTGDVGKGPSSTTGYYTGVNPQSGGYTIYLQKTGAPGELSYGTAANDSELISYTNSLAGTSYTTANECLTYFAGQSDKICVNRDYEGIITDGLIFNFDSGFTPSYPRSGTSCVDVSTSAFSGSLVNGTSYNSGNGGNIVFDGSDDYVRFSSFSQVNVSSWTCQVFAKTASSSSEGYVFGWRGSSALVTIGTWAGSWISHCSATQVEWINGPSASQNVWTCITASYDSGTQRIYSNGQFYSSRSATFANPASYIDLGAINGAFNFNGSLAICLFYNRALSAAEVLQNYNAQKSRFGL